MQGVLLASPETGGVTNANVTWAPFRPPSGRKTHYACIEFDLTLTLGFARTSARTSSHIACPFKMQSDLFAKEIEEREIPFLSCRPVCRLSQPISQTVILYVLRREILPPECDTISKTLRFVVATKRLTRIFASAAE